MDIYPMKTNDNPKTPLLTDFIFETFRLHGDLIAFGDEMAKEFGLTSARWQVLGSVAMSKGDVTVPVIARNLSLSRQAVQRVATDLVRERFVTFLDNPHHKRAKLVALTPDGKKAYRGVEKKYLKWAKTVGQGIKSKDVQNAIFIMRAIGSGCIAYMKDAQKWNGK